MPHSATITPVTLHRHALRKLADQITQLAAHLDAGEYRLLQLIEQFDREGGWQALGMHSCAHWLNWKCGISMGAARERVRVARALPGLPQISQAFKQGRISYSKVRAMTRVATPKNEAVLMNVAIHGTASHVELQVRSYRKTQRLEALKKENQRHAHRQLRWYTDEDGHWKLEGRFTAEQGALIQKALEAAANELFAESQPVESPSARKADALERLAQSFLTAPKEHVQNSGGDRYLVHVHSTAETLKADGATAEAEMHGDFGPAGHVPAETCRRMACDASRVNVTLSEHGEPLSIGRKSRTIPPAIRRALKLRDRGCVFPGCSCTRFVDAHHVVHWADGGETSLDNLVLLCRRHHRLVHEGGFGLQIGVGKKPEFTTPEGQRMEPSGCGRSRGNVIELQLDNARNGLEITPRTPASGFRGESMDTSLAVLLLQQAER